MIQKTADFVAYNPYCREQSELGLAVWLLPVSFIIGIVDDSSRKKQNLKFPA
jgi:hypothetical protein